MKVIQLSDIHIHDEKIVECDPVVNFNAAMKHIGEHHKDADMIVISGDLTHCGTTENIQDAERYVGGMSDATSSDYREPRQ